MSTSYSIFFAISFFSSLFRLNEIIKNNVVKYLIMSFPFTPEKPREAQGIFCRKRKIKIALKKKAKKEIKLLNGVKIPTAKISLLQTCSWRECSCGGREGNRENYKFKFKDYFETLFKMYQHHDLLLKVSQISCEEFHGATVRLGEQ